MFLKVLITKTLPQTHEFFLRELVQTLLRSEISSFLPISVGNCTCAVPIRQLTGIEAAEQWLFLNIFYFSHSFKLSADGTMFKLRAYSLNSAQGWLSACSPRCPVYHGRSEPICTHDFCNARSKCRLYTFTLKAKAKCRKKVLHWVKNQSEVILT